MKKAFFATLAMVMAATSLWGASILVKWNANTETDLAGYNVFYAGPTDPGWTRENGQWKYTETTLPNEVKGVTEPSYHLNNAAPGPYAFGITAFDTSGNESAISEIATVLVPEPAAVIVVPPINLPPEKPTQIIINLVK